MAQSFSGKRILITGGTGGLGSAVTRAFIDAGAEVHVTWVHEKELERFELRDCVKLHQADVASDSAVVDLYRSAGSLWASIHLVGGFAMAPIEKTTAEDVTKMFNGNAMTAFLCCREAVKNMRLGGRGGRIVNVAARPAVVPAGGMVAYSISKAAVASLTQSLAEEVKDDRILVNAVVPSLMDTPANRKSMPDSDYSKWPKVEEVAKTILFLASEDNGLTSGALVPVYGRM